MQFKKYTKQRSRTIQGLRSFKNTLPTNVKKIIIRKGEIFSNILENWKFIVGDDLFKICHPKSIKNTKQFRKRYLKIMVQKGTEVEVEYSKNVIIDKLNSFVGYKIVDTIKIETFERETSHKKNKKRYAAKSNYSKKISSVKNDKIKKSLIELEKLIKKR
tara:strand:+ start:246 stop:725 length:480 start_codon:yes stop_codon:yes gene_type:complete